MMEYNSGGGALSMALARRFPNATMISLESKKTLIDSHLRALEVAENNGEKLHNNIVCHTNVDGSMITKLYESPEFMRFQIMSGNLIDHLVGEEMLHIQLTAPCAVNGSTCNN
jgi:methylase of polypeptide subunit release factors